MKKNLPFLLLLVCLIATGSAWAAGRVAADLSEDFVAVSENFSGARLTVFGALRGASDIALVIEGPREDAMVRTKKRIMGVWVNGDPTTLENVPSFYAVATSRPLPEMVSESMALKYNLDAAFVLPQSEAAKGFLEVKTQQKLYQYIPKGVHIMEWKLFRVDVDLPANVPIGEYKAHIYEFINGHFFASRTSPLKVGQVGTGAKLNQMAHEEPYFYAFFALLLSLSIGGGAAYLFRKVS
ncbi:MAG: TIGR02186 family protein [Bdellovibrionales bacterium]